MGQKLVTIILAVLVGVALGLVIAGKKIGSPFVQTTLKNQEAVVATLQRMEQKIGSGDVAAKVQDLDTRLKKIENIFKLIEQQQPQAPQEDFTTKFDIPVGESYVVGDKNAKVIVTEFIDFQCPYCAHFHPPVMQAVSESSGKAALLVKNYPLSFHPNARPAAKFALAAGEQGKYGEVVDKILENGKSLGDETYKKIAQELRLDWGKIEKVLKDKDSEYERRINDDIELGNKIGVMGTPTFYINGHKSQSRDLNAWKQEIEREAANSK